MNEGMTVLLWLVLLGALAIPVVWVAWVVLKRMKADERTADTSPESSEETTKQ